MEYEFYIDLFFLTSLFYNYLSLYLSSVFLKKKRKYWRLICAAGFGSVWNCAIIMFPVFPPFTELLLDLCIVGPIMIGIAFVPTDRRGVSKAVGALYTASALIGGAMSFCRQFLWLNDGEILALCGCICFLTGTWVKPLTEAAKLGEERYFVRLFYRGKEKSFLALVDSGNRLRVPETGKSVSLISAMDCAEFCEKISGGFYVPYRAVGTGQGVLFATTFEKMEIEKDGETICIKNPVVAFSKEYLSVDRSFSMILPEEYVR